MVKNQANQHNPDKEILTRKEGAAAHVNELEKNEMPRKSKDADKVTAQLEKLRNAHKLGAPELTEVCEQLSEMYKKHRVTANAIAEALYSQLETGTPALEDYIAPANLLREIEDRVSIPLIEKFEKLVLTLIYDKTLKDKDFPGEDETCSDATTLIRYAGILGTNKAAKKFIDHYSRIENSKSGEARSIREELGKAIGSLDISSARILLEKSLKSKNVETRLFAISYLASHDSNRYRDEINTFIKDEHNFVIRHGLAERHLPNEEGLIKLVSELTHVLGANASERRWGPVSIYNTVTTYLWYGGSDYKSFHREPRLRALNSLLLIAGRRPDIVKAIAGQTIRDAAKDKWNYKRLRKKAEGAVKAIDKACET